MVKKTEKIVKKIDLIRIIPIINKGICLEVVVIIMRKIVVN